MRDPPARRRARAVFRRRPLAQALTAAWLLPALVLAIAHCPAWALPTGAELAAGQATVRQSDALTMQVHQTSNKAVLNWQSFGIERNETVQFLQPSTSAITLNRVLGRDPSAIFGRLNANGQVFLINPNGVVFGANARVDVGGIVASTLGLSNNDFLAGRYAFSADGSTASVSNAGALRAADGGYVVLLGNQVVNTGTLAAPRGSVALGAGERISLDFHGDGLLSLAVDASAVKALVSNAGLIDAAGGAVTLSARARNALLDTVLNVEGTVRATSLVERNGAIFLDGGESGVTRVSGTLDASGAVPGLTGGRVTVLGEKIGLFDGAALDASGAAGGGRVLVGGNWQGLGPERNAQMTHVAAGVRIDASATDHGNGGTAVVWSDDTTRFFGAADARGGVASGDGGFVEVSGKSYLDFRGSSDRSAPRGKAGMLLLDPTNLTISNSANTNVNAATPFAPGAGGVSSTLNWGTLLTALGLGDVIVTTAGSPATTGNLGDITIAASPSSVYSTANALTLTTAATGAIIVNAAVSNTGAGGLNLNAGAGGVQFNAGVTLTGGSLGINSGGAVTQTGDLRVGGTTSIMAGTNAITLANPGNDFTGAVTLNSTGASVSIRDTNALILAAPTLGATTGLSATSGTTLTLPAAVINTGTGAMTLQSLGGSLSTAGALSGGTVDLLGSNGLNLGHTVTAGGALTLGSTNSAISQTAGALTVAGVTTVNAGTGAITLAQANSFAGDVALFNSGSNNAAVTADALTLGASTLGGALTAVATVGSITQTGVITTGSSGSSFSTTTAGRAIDLATQVNRFGSHSVSFNTTGAADVAVKAETLNFATSNVGGKLSATTTVGGILQIGAITASSLELATAHAQVSLGSPTNAVSSLGATSLGAGVLSFVNGGTLTVIAPLAASGGITLKSMTGNVALTENLNAGAAGVAFSAPLGAILQDAGRVITAGALGVEALAAPMLVTNGPLRTISANITGANNPFAFTQAGTFNVGSVEGAGARISGVKTNGGTISLTATSGNLTMSQTVDAGAAVVNLSAPQGSITQSVTQSGGGAVKGVLLTTASATGQALTGPNAVASFRASNSNSGDIALSNTAAQLAIIGITNAAANGSFAVTNTGNTAVSGAVRTTGSGQIALATTGSLALGSDLDAGAGSVVLASSNGTITQTQGRTITARELGVQATAAPALTTSGSLTTIAARITGAGNPFAFTQAGTFAVGAVGSLSGVSTQGGAITLSATSGDLTMSRAVDAGAAAVTLSAAQGSISQAGAGAVRSAALSTQSRSGQLLGGANAVGSFNAANSTSGNVALNHTGAPLLVTGITNAALSGNVTVTNTGATTIGGPVRTAGAGLITLIGPAGLSLNGPLDAGSGGVVLSALNGAITQAAGGTITAGSLGVEAVAAPSLSASGTLRTIAAHITGLGNAFAFEQAGTFDVGSVQGTGARIDGVKTHGGTVSLTASVGELTMSQPVDAGAAAVNLSAAQSSITQTAGGAVKGALLTTVSGSGQALAGANAVGGFNAVNSSGGDIVLNNTTAPSTATLTLTGIYNRAANGGVAVTNAGALNTRGAVRGAGAGLIVLETTHDLVLGGDVDAGRGGVVLSARAGTITQGAGGMITASGLGVQATVAPLLAHSNLGTIAADITGAGSPFAYTQAGPFDVGTVGLVSGVRTRDAAVTLTASAGDLTMSRPVDAGAGALNLSAPLGSITQAGGGAVKGALLTTVSGSGQALTAANAVGGFNATNSNSGSVWLNNTAALLTVTGIANNAANGSATVSHTGALTTAGAIRTAAGGVIALQANNGALTLGQPVTASGAGTVTLKTTGAGRAISQDANGVLTAGTLSLYAVDADATLNQAPNRVARVQGVDLGRGALVLHADAAVLTAAGIVAQGGLEITNRTGDITTAGDLNVGAGNLTLDATAAGKTIIPGGALTASNDLVLRADAALDTGAGRVRATNGRATLSSRSAGVAVGAGGLSAATTVALVAGGAGSEITQRAGGAITAESLTLSTQDGHANLDTVAHALTRLGTVALGRGALSLLNAGPMTVTGPVAATGGIRLDTGGALTLAGPLDAAAGAVALSTRGGAAGTITQGAAGGITTASLSLKTVDAGVSLDTAPNAVGGLGPTALGTGALSLRSAGGLTVTGAVAAGGGVTLNTGGALALNDTVDAGTGTVALRTGGGAGSTVGQSARGRITAASLSLATAGADVSLDAAANAVAQLTTTALGAGALKLRTAGGVTVTGAVAATGGVGLTAGGPLTLNNTVDAGTGMVALATQGPGHAITQNAAGRVSADTLTLATEGGDATLNTAPHALRQLGAAALGSGRLSLLDEGGLTVAGPVVAGGVSLTTGGGLNVDGLVNVGAGSLTLTATGAGNDITQALAGRIVVGALVLDGGNITLGQVELGVMAAAGRAGPGWLALRITAEDSAAITVENAGVTLGATAIGTRAQNGNFTLSAAGNISQSATLKVSGDSRFVASLPENPAGETLDVVLAGANLFGGSVSVTGANLENVSLSAPTLQIGESAGVNSLFPLLTGAGIVGRNVSLRTDLLTSTGSSRDDVRGSIVVRDKGVLSLQAFTDGKDGSFGTPARPVKVQFQTPLALSQDSVNVLPAIGSVVYLVGPVAPAPFYSRGLRPLCYNFLGARCQRLNTPITQTALNVVYSELRRLIEEVLRSGYSKENVQAELIKGLVLESGMAPPALDDIVGDGIRLPR